MAHEPFSSDTRKRKLPPSTSTQEHYSYLTLDATKKNCSMMNIIITHSEKGICRPGSEQGLQGIKHVLHQVDRYHSPRSSPGLRLASPNWSTRPCIVPGDRTYDILVLSFWALLRWIAMFAAYIPRYLPFWKHAPHFISILHIFLNTTCFLLLNQNSATSLQSHWLYSD